MLTALVIALTALQPPAGQPATPPAPTPPSGTGQPPPAAQPVAPATPPIVSATSFATADDLLFRLEEADKSIKSLQTGIQYTKKFAGIEGGDMQVWRGKLYFDVVESPNPPKPKDGKDTPPPKRRFAVIFSELLVPEGKGKSTQMVSRKETKHLIFDGEWFVERNESAKQFTKRRVVKPGERTDPLRLGEGPFPLPIGQKRDDIVKRFKAEVLPHVAGLEDLPADKQEQFAGTVQLRLTPLRPTREARELAEVRVWYMLPHLLPRLVRAKTAEGAETEILLIRHETNQPIEPNVFNTDPPKEPGWDVDIRDDFRAPSDE